MATSRSGHQTDEARLRALREIDETERAMIEGINSGSMLGGKSGKSMAHNATQRAQYIRTLQENSAMFRAQANELASAGSLEELTILTEAAVDARNEALVATRSRVTKMGKVFSKHLKDSGLTLEQLLAKKSRDLHSISSFNELNATQKSDVLLAVIDSSGKSRQSVNRMTRFLGVAGKALFVASIAAMVFTVATAEDPALQLGLSVGEFAVGFIGGELAIAAITGSATIAAALGPLGVLVLAGVAVVAIGVGAYFLFDHLGGLFQKSPKEWKPSSEVIVPSRNVPEVYGVDIKHIFGVSTAVFFRANPIWRVDLSMYRADTSMHGADTSMYSADRTMYGADKSIYKARSPR